MKVINLKNYGVVVFESKLTVDVFKALKKHMPNALKAKDEEGNELFALDFNVNGTGSISNYGVCFNRADSEGNALITVQETLTTEEVADKYAAVILKAQEQEKWALEAYESLQEQLLEVAESIVDGDAQSCACTNPEVKKAKESEEK